MLNKRLFLTAAACTAILTATTAAAVPYSSFDPRSFGMGGVGVAAGTSANAVFFNPALLSAAPEGEDFSLELPIIGGRVADPNDLVDAVDDFNDTDPISAFETAVNNYIVSPTAANETAVSTTGATLISQLQNLSDKILQVEGDAAFVVGKPGRGMGFSVFANAYVVGGTLGTITNTDLAAIQQTIDDTTDGNLATIPSDPTGSLTSSVSARFATLAEAGVALSRELDLFGGIAVGITPKYVEVKTYDYRFVGNEIDTADIDLDQGEQSDTDFNVDVGVAKDYGNGWKAGLAVRNLLSREYTTVLDNKLKIEPMARLGISRRNEWITVAADLDLTENEPAGFESKTQYAAVGVEFDVFDTAQLRLGYRHNMSDLPSDMEAGVASAGFGFSPFGVHIDASVAGNSDEIGGALQLGFRF